MTLTPKTRERVTEVVLRTRARLDAAKARGGVELHLDIATVELLVRLSLDALKRTK